MAFPISQMIWTRPPKEYTLGPDSITLVTEPGTDLWPRTYYGFRNDNAPVLQLETEEKYFSFTVKTAFESHHRYDQCGVAVYLDSDHWLNASVEYENEEFQRLGRHSLFHKICVVSAEPPGIGLLPGSFL